MGRSYAQNMQRLVEQYREADQPWPTTARRIAAWAIENGLWKPHPSKIHTLCTEQISKAMREEYYIDPQGRKVRTKHVALLNEGDEQRHIWEDIRSKNRDHMAVAFQQRRNLIVDDCQQLKTDGDSFNENSCPDNPIPMSFDFTDDLAEIEAEKNAEDEAA